MPLFCLEQLLLAFQNMIQKRRNEILRISYGTDVPSIQNMILLQLSARMEKRCYRLYIIDEAPAKTFTPNQTKVYPPI